MNVTNVDKNSWIKGPDTRIHSIERVEINIKSVEKVLDKNRAENFPNLGKEKDM